MNLADPRSFLTSLLDAAIAAAAPARVVPEFLPEPPRGRTILVGAGKAAAAMAQAVEEHWQGDLAGLVVTRHGYGAPCRRIEVIEASHPVPDTKGRDAARRILDLVHGLTEDDLVLFLASGGGSALMALPAPGIALDDKQQVTRALLKSGATIGEINSVRKHLSAVKGGRLAAAAFPARIVTLAISDVAGDDPSVIASGPTVADPSNFAEARATLKKYSIAPPSAVVRHLAEARDETPKPGDPRLARSEYVLVATPQRALEAAAAVARATGVAPLILADAIEGEAREIALVHAGIARQAAKGKLIAGDAPLPLPCVILSGGEATVTVRGEGRGGPNTEFILALALALRGHRQIHALAADTDGIDGTEDNAGAMCGPDTGRRATAKAIDLAAALAANDSYGALRTLEELVMTGPTRTNINDFRALLVMPERP